MRKKESILDRSYYFLNAVYYCLWLFSLKINAFIYKTMKIIFYPLWMNMSDEDIKRLDDFNMNRGFYTPRWRLRALFCGGYVLFIPLILLPLMMRYYVDADTPATFFICMAAYVIIEVAVDIFEYKGALKKDVM